MGLIVKVRCSVCERNERFFLGSGFLHPPSTVFGGDSSLLLSLVRSRRINDEAVEAIERGGVPFDEYGYEIYGCSRCRRLYERFFFCILHDGEWYEPGYRCWRCKGTLLRVARKEHDDKILEWECSHCGGELIEGGVGCWD